MKENDTKLSIEEVGRIVNFLGYGNPCKSVWFIGIEEGLGKMNSLEARKNLKARATFHRTMDLREAHLRLQEDGHRIDIERNPPCTQVWQYMAKIMLAKSGRTDWQDDKAFKEYIRLRLGRTNDETFLSELSPVPSSKAADKQWLAYLREIDPEIEVKIDERNRHLKQLIHDNNPKMIICYGSRADEFAELLGVKWQQEVCPKVYASNDFKCLLLPFFGYGHMSHSVIQSLIALEALQ